MSSITHKCDKNTKHHAHCKVTTGDSDDFFAPFTDIDVVAKRRLKINKKPPISERREIKGDMMEMVSEFKEFTNKFCDDPEGFLESVGVMENITEQDVARSVKDQFKVSLDEFCDNRDKYFQKLDKKAKKFRFKRIGWETSWTLNTSQSILTNDEESLKHKKYFNEKVMPSLKIRKIIKSDVYRVYFFF